MLVVVSKLIAKSGAAATHMMSRPYSGISLQRTMLVEQTAVGNLRYIGRYAVAKRIRYF